MASEALAAGARFEAEYNAMDLAVMAVFRVVDASPADRPHRAELELTPEVHQALLAGHYRLGSTAGLVEAIEARLDAGERLSGSDAVALERLYRRLDNDMDDGGPEFRLASGGR